MLVLLTSKEKYMRGKSWDRVAEEQFKAMPDEYKDDWQSLKNDLK